MYKRRMPTDTPLKSLGQVVVAAFRKVSVRVPTDAGLLYEVHDKIEQPKIAHTDEFGFLDKAAVVAESDLEEVTNDAAAAGSSSWRLCTVTQVEDLKILLRLLPIWATKHRLCRRRLYVEHHVSGGEAAVMDMRVMSPPPRPCPWCLFEVFVRLAWVLISTAP
ncbi:unnamed protein product [Miscanthus lutarioriparius]|uniref:Uncharacterized protein n=1 Tax=Miscanthus lutarioriparius TaxID=422564 RepID=A0A811QUC7_9POAL|nr:unnamed protein product [Miscanthus lutarioriparius]